MTCRYSSLFCPTKINILCLFSFVFCCSLTFLKAYISLYKLPTLRSFCGSRSHLNFIPPLCKILIQSATEGIAKSTEVWRHQIFFFAFQHFHDHISVERMKNPHTPNLTWIGSWWHAIWPHEYLISPIEMSVNWPS